MLVPWEKLLPALRTEAVRPYYDALARRRGQLFWKRCFDIAAAFLGILLTAPLCLILAVWIVLDSPGTPIFRQERVTANGKRFRIHKFRSMTVSRNGQGSSVTTSMDTRITRAGRLMRRFHLDEIPQLIDILGGNMTFVGTRPEVPEFVDAYTPEMYATLLLPAGLTSEASIRFQDEAEMLGAQEDADTAYIRVLLPEKMKVNLQQLALFSLRNDWRCLVHTLTGMGRSRRERVMRENRA